MDTYRREWRARLARLRLPQGVFVRTCWLRRLPLWALYWTPVMAREAQRSLVLTR